MSDTNDKRLSFRPYRQTIERVQTQFDLIRFSLQSLTPKDQKEFFQKVSEEKIAKIEKFRLSAKKHKIFPDEEVDQMANEQVERIKSELRREKRAGNLRFTSEFTEDGLNQSELLLLVAHFESFMKLVHERFLLAAPNRVFGTAFRGEQTPKILIKEIFDADQVVWNPQKFLKEQIAKEVKWLDAQNIETKADYFAKYFGISFGKPDEIEELKGIMKLRNKISHEIYAPPKTENEVLTETLEMGKEQPLVPDPQLKKARMLFNSIPQSCIKYGGKTYQSYFKEY
jgi:hypothetical protein